MLKSGILEFVKVCPHNPKNTVGRLSYISIRFAVVVLYLLDCLVRYGISDHSHRGWLEAKAGLIFLASKPST